MTFHSCKHGWGSAEEHLVQRLRFRHALVDHIFSDEAHTTSPGIGRIVEHVVDLEA